MRKITFFIIVLFYQWTFGIPTPNSREEVFQEEIIVLDAVIEDPAFYLDQDYDVPTKLLFPNLITVKSSLDISRNSNLIGIEAPLLEEVGDNLVIDENPNLSKIYFPKLKSVVANLVFVENPELKQIDLSELSKTGGDVHIYANPLLEFLEISQLQKICGGFGFHLNHSIITLNLPSLISIGHFCGAHIGSFFHIFNNDSLEFVNAPNFEKVDFVSISNNPQLKKLNLCNLVVDETFDVANNHPSINQGPPYCYNQPEETENEDSDDAITEVDDSLERENVENESDVESNEENTSVYPNPSDTEIHIDVDREIVGIHILDFTGNLVKAFTNSQNSYDVSDIASGIYYMVVYYIDGTSYSKKIIIR